MGTFFAKVVITIVCLVCVFALILYISSEIEHEKYEAKKREEERRREERIKKVPIKDRRCDKWCSYASCQEYITLCNEKAELFPCSHPDIDEIVNVNEHIGCPYYDCKFIAALSDLIEQEKQRG